jgi:hypothetical protein
MFPENYLIEIQPNEAKTRLEIIRSEVWRTMVLSLLVQLESSDAGKILLNGIAHTGQWVRIEPNADPNSCKAETVANAQISHTTRHIFSKLFFSPDQFMNSSPCFGRKHLSSIASNRGALPKEVLFHELVHALRHTSRKLSREKATDGLMGYGNAEEFYAVVLSNIYIGDPTNKLKSGIRRDHNGFGPIERSLETSFEFFQSGEQVYGLIKQFTKDHPYFAKAMSEVRGDFNPLAAYFHNEPRAKALSHSALAKARDLRGGQKEFLKDFLHKINFPLPVFKGVTK